MRKVTVAVDESEQAKRSLLWYLDNIFREGDVVTLITVFDNPVFSFDPLTTEALAALESYKREAEMNGAKVQKQYLDICRSRNVRLS
mmetsp:Transcript_4297/g.10206  ORF Transcript_4297/g.10206 Transcript_4297/m.10206 type:complete len:87 (+) Transcript_4297:82-342(+)